jgi:hypothetical protein
MTDIATTLTAAIQRVSANIINSIAKDGLQLFKNTLDESGLSKTPELKDYEVNAYVSGDTITFELMVHSESVIPVDDNAQQALDGMQQKIQAIRSMAARTYGMSKRGGVQSLVGRRDGRRDARSPTKSATRSARSAFKTSDDRSIDHEVAAKSPRYMDVKAGKLLVSFRRSIRQTEKNEFVMPRGEFEGIPNIFLQKLKSTIAKKFNPELDKILKRYI